ncbi:unnamed protein product [Danaus chrysippus]|uniref:(African queen) hypothetical protein n=1 Tax=Danaus chrysippus TaxID=151541 RepID=A0A8J2W7P3_9NEOP|nr:unnamed protein product [Danaus chrysippus]
MSIILTSVRMRTPTDLNFEAFPLEKDRRQSGYVRETRTEILIDRFTSRKTRGRDDVTSYPPMTARGKGATR